MRGVGGNRIRREYTDKYACDASATSSNSVLVREVREEESGMDDEEEDPTSSESQRLNGAIIRNTNKSCWT